MSPTNNVNILALTDTVAYNHVDTFVIVLIVCLFATRSCHFPHILKGVHVFIR